MTFEPRPYEEIVRDLLTTLTGGTVREEVSAPLAGQSDVPELLVNRPVRRVSHLVGPVKVGVGPDERVIQYKFTSADFELVSRNGDGALDTIRFREGGRRPDPGTKLVVNYYPVSADPVPLTDANVGSVTRTLVETFARELALTELHLGHIYRSAFLETAEGSSLDKVVALVGVSRLPAGYPIVGVRLSRGPSAPGRITVPAGTALTDAAGNRYLTMAEVTLEPNEQARTMQARGEGPGTAPVEPGALNRLEVLVAGISEVTNPEPARRLAAPETDEELRARARGALHGVVRGTLDAIRFGLLAIEGVKDVTIVEEPNGIPGEIRVQVAYVDETDREVQRLVERTLEELKPAGVRARPAAATAKRISFRVELTLAGSGLPDAEVGALNGGVEARLRDHLARIPPGGTLRQAQLTSLVLQDARVVDARVAVLPVGATTPVTDLTLASGEVLEIEQVVFPRPTSERPPTTPPTTTTVEAILPIQLRSGVTAANARAAIMTALERHLGTRAPDAPLTVDSLAAEIRDESRFGLIRGEVIVTVRRDGANGADGRFLQLTDAAGAYSPGVNELLRAGQIDVDAREGTV